MSDSTTPAPRPVARRSLPMASMAVTRRPAATRARLRRMLRVVTDRRLARDLAAMHAER